MMIMMTTTLTTMTMIIVTQQRSQVRYHGTCGTQLKPAFHTKTATSCKAFCRISVINLSVQLTNKFGVLFKENIILCVLVARQTNLYYFPKTWHLVPFLSFAES